MRQLMGFIDAGFLRAEGTRAVLGRRTAGAWVDCAKLVAWLRDRAEVEDATFLRAYWYDGSFDPSHPGFVRQEQYFRAVARTPGLQLRLGHLVERPNPQRRAILNAVSRCGADPGEFEQHFQLLPIMGQKGVDTLLVLDLVRLAQNGACRTALLFTGDRDMAEAVRTAQDSGCRVVLVYPHGARVAEELRHLVDEQVCLSPSETAELVHARGAQAA